MKNYYKFSLERVLELRKEESKKIMIEMSPAVANLNKITNDISTVKENLVNLNALNFANDDSNLNLNQAIDIGYKIHLKKLITALKEEKLIKIQNLEGFKKKLNEAKIKEKSLEIIKNKRKKKWNKKLLQQQERIQEEMVVSLNTNKIIVD